MNGRSQSASRPPPGARLLQAALAGLLSMGAHACSSGTTPDPPAETQAHITSSRIAEGLTESSFKEMCDAVGGTVEVLAHCGGLATARGFSYDTTTQTLAEHTCKGANTCAGWNCIVPGQS
jgi:hypothetical protein